MLDSQILVPLVLLNGRNYGFNETLKYYIWKIAWDVLHTREFVAQRIAGLDSFCPWCHHPQESVVHVLFECLLPLLYGGTQVSHQSIFHPTKVSI